MLLLDHNYSKKNIKEIASLFGAVKLEDAYYTLTPDESSALFFPNFNPRAKTGWNNVHLTNGDLTESNNDPVVQAAHLKMHIDDQPFDQLRLVFGKIDGEYRFLGLFQLDKAESRHQNLLYWRRLSDTYLFLGPVHLDAKAIQSKFIPLKQRFQH